MHSIGSDHQVVITARDLPSHAPIRSDAANVEAEICTGIRLQASNVFRAIDRARKVKMIIPHGVTADAGDILTERPIDNCGC